jgi:hypothetical protein
MEISEDRTLSAGLACFRHRPRFRCKTCYRPLAELLTEEVSISSAAFFHSNCGFSPRSDGWVGLARESETRRLRQRLALNSALAVLDTIS